MPDEDQEQLQPPQRQSQPGIQQEMTPEPDSTRPQHQGSDKLVGKVALITGGDSGIGRAVAVLFAREGADVAIGHLAEEDTDANETVKLVEAEGRRCLTYRVTWGTRPSARTRSPGPYASSAAWTCWSTTPPSSTPPRASARSAPSSWSGPSAPTSSPCSS